MGIRRREKDCGSQGCTTSNADLVKSSRPATLVITIFQQQKHTREFETAQLERWLGQKHHKHHWNALLKREHKQLEKSRLWYDFLPLLIVYWCLIPTAIVRVMPELACITWHDWPNAGLILSPHQRYAEIVPEPIALKHADWLYSPTWPYNTC